MKLLSSHGVKSRNDGTMKMPRLNRRKKGFSMIELMVTIAVFSVLMAMAVTSMSGKQPLWKLKGGANNVAQMFGKARFEAIKRGRPVLVQLSNMGTLASMVTLYRDNNRNDIAGDAGDDLLEQVTISSQYMNVMLTNYVDCNGPASLISFGTDGTIKQINAAGRGAMPLVITLDNTVATNPDTYQVIIERSGIGRVETGYVPSC